MVQLLLKETFCDDFPPFFFERIPLQIVVGVLSQFARKSVCDATVVVTCVNLQRMFDFGFGFCPNKNGRHFLVRFPDKTITGNQIFGVGNAKSKQIQLNTPWTFAVATATDRTISGRLWERWRIPMSGQNRDILKIVTITGEFPQFE